MVQDSARKIFWYVKQFVNQNLFLFIIWKFFVVLLNYLDYIMRTDAQTFLPNLGERPNPRIGARFRIKRPYAKNPFRVDVIQIQFLNNIFNLRMNVGRELEFHN
jgi:hypothetical protein